MTGALRLTARIAFVKIYYIAFALYIFSVYLNGINFCGLALGAVSLIDKACRYVFVSLLLIKISSYRFNSKMLVCFVGGLLSAGLSALSSSSWDMLILLLLFIGARDVEIKKLATIVLIEGLFILFSVLFGLLCGYVVDSFSQRVGSAADRRFSLGFKHPNTLGGTLMMICYAYSLTKFRSFFFKDALFCIPFLLLCALVAVSKTSTFCILFTVCLSLFYTKAKESFIKNSLMKLFAAVFICLIALSLSLMFLYDENIGWMTFLNTVLTERPALSNYFFSNLSIGLFGKNIEGLNAEYLGMHGFIVDNAYAYNVLRYGVVPSLLLFVGMLYVLYISGRSERLYICGYAFIICAVTAFCETIGLRFAMLFPLCAVIANQYSSRFYSLSVAHFRYDGILFEKWQTGIKNA